MQLDISTRHGHLNDATRDKLRTKAEKLGRFFERLTAIEVVVHLEDSQKMKVDLKVSAEHKHDFVAHEQGDNLIAAMDAAVQKIEQQLRKYKQRVQERHRSPEPRRQEPAAEGGLEGEA